MMIEQTCTLSELAHVLKQPERELLKSGADGERPFFRAVEGVTIIWFYRYFDQVNLPERPDTPIIFADASDEEDQYVEELCHLVDIPVDKPQLFRITPETIARLTLMDDIGVQFSIPDGAGSTEPLPNTFDEIVSKICSLYKNSAIPGDSRVARYERIRIKDLRCVYPEPTSQPKCLAEEKTYNGWKEIMSAWASHGQKKVSPRQMRNLRAQGLGAKHPLPGVSCPFLFSTEK